MKGVCYEFRELESAESFEALSNMFGGVLLNNTLQFDNAVVKGELIKQAPEQGLWLRIWKLTVYKEITLCRLPANADDEKKYSLIYFLNPSIFKLKQNQKKIPFTCQHNNLFLPNDVLMTFNVLPKQPFYVVDITFTATWLLQQFNTKNTCFADSMKQRLGTSIKSVLKHPCTAQEYQTLHELEERILAHEQDLLFTRSRTYSLICSFFDKVMQKQQMKTAPGAIRYEQVIVAQNLILKNLQLLPKIETIAAKVNMSPSSLLRQFRLMYGKSIYEYALEKKMELAKKLMVEEQLSVKAIAYHIGYKHASTFIEAFTKWHGCSPGNLKLYQQ